MDAILDRRPPPPIPVTLLTGFLGAGKTTLLNRLLRAPEFAGSLVLVNEFGDVGLDHLLIEGGEEGAVLLESGCLCCTIRGQLVSALEDLLRKRDNGRIAAFSRLVVETTGLADPAPILGAFLAHPYLALRYRLDAVVTVVDGAQGRTTMDAHEEAAKQAVAADRLVIGKRDIASAHDLGALEADLRRLNPAAPIFDATTVAAGELLAKPGDAADWLAAAARLPATDGHGHDHDHHGHDADAAQDGRDPSRHSARIRGYVLRRAAPIGAGRLDLFLSLLRAALGPKLLRVKGLVKLDDDPGRPLLVQAVQKSFHPPVRLDGWPDSDRDTRIVFIVDGVSPETIDRFYAAFAGETAADAPDAAALADNPLAPRAGGLLE